MTRSLRYLAPVFSSTLDADLRPSPGSLPGTIPLRPSQGVLLTLPAAIVRTHRWAGHWGSRVGREGKRCVEVAYLVSSQTQQDLEAQGARFAGRK